MFAMRTGSEHGESAFTTACRSEAWEMPATTLPVSRWQAPVKIRKTCEIAIESNPLTTGFDSQGSEPCIGNKVSPGIRVPAKACEDVPVPLARLNQNAMRLFEQ